MQLSTRGIYKTILASKHYHVARLCTGDEFPRRAQVLDLPSVAVISEKYATLLTPAGYAFSIWSLIYVLLVVSVVYQARDVFRPNKPKYPAKFLI